MLGHALDSSQQQSLLRKRMHSLPILLAHLLFPLLKQGSDNASNPPQHKEHKVEWLKLLDELPLQAREPPLPEHLGLGVFVVGGGGLQLWGDLF